MSEDELQGRLERLAERERRTRGRWIDEALRDYPGREKPRAERYRRSPGALEEIEAGAPTADGDGVPEWIESRDTEAEWLPLGRRLDPDRPVRQWSIRIWHGWESR